VIDRPRHTLAIRRVLRRSRVVSILGARQVGKTTLARLVAGSRGTWFDLEDPADLTRVAADPMLALRGLRGLVVLDEVQRAPTVFESLRVLADRPRGARFMLLGSASPDLVRGMSETLAGRIELVDLSPLALDEVGANAWARLWLRGGFPRSFTARTDGDSVAWRRDFVRTFVERDASMLVPGAAAATVDRLWAMVAHWHGQVLNVAELGRSLAISEATVRRYIDILGGTFVVRVLRPWHENLAKRQVKAPKVYVSDSGMLHALLGIDTMHALDRHPKVGASWEGFALEQVIARLGARPSDCYFWATHQGAELDLLVARGTTRRGFEFKRADAPTMTASMRIAMEDLKLDSIEVIHPGANSYPLAPKIRAVAIADLWNAIAPLRG
jgi:uncharacterized protein